MRKLRFLLGALLIIDMLAVLAIYFNFPNFLRGRAQVAPVSLTASVFPNSYNTLAQQLRQKEDALGKENELQQKEAVLQDTITKAKNKLLFYFGAAGGILFLLVIYNFYLDYKRNRKSGFTIMKP